MLMINNRKKRIKLMESTFGSIKKKTKPFIRDRNDREF